MRDFSKSKFCYVIQYKRPSLSCRLLISWLRTNRNLRNGSISLKFLKCNNFAAFSRCCCVIIIEFARLKKKTQWNWDRYPVVGDFRFKRLHRNDSFSLKCMVCNHFVIFSSCCCVIMTEFAPYNEKNWGEYPVVDEVFAATLCSNSVSAQRFFCR